MAVTPSCDTDGAEVKGVLKVEVPSSRLNAGKAAGCRCYFRSTQPMT